MASSPKEWLVRTKSRDIVGPFSLRELVQKLKDNEISLEDEMSPPAGSWISVQTLQARDVEEVTRTSTRVTGTDTRNVDDTSDPTEDTNPSVENQPKTPLYPQKEIAKANTKSKVAPFLMGAIVSLFFVALFLYFNSSGGKSKSNDMLSTATAFDGDSKMTQRANELIHRGEKKLALKELSEYHEKQMGKGELSYLIPYSALLITEGESSTRARKFLETILASHPSNPLKSKAHHWLGYLDLMEGEEGYGEDHFLEVLQLNTKDVAAQFNLGRAYLMQENFQKALDYLQLAELEMPDLYLIHIYKGRAKTQLNLQEEARQSFQTAIQNANDRWLSYIYYASFLFKYHEFNEARQVLKKMLTRDPSYEIYSPPPYGFYQEALNYSEYLELFNQIMEKAPTEEKELGRLYLSYISDPQGASGKRILALAVSGNLYCKVIALKVALEKRMAAEEIKTLLERLPPNLNEFGYFAYVLRADAKRELGNLTEAQQDYRRALVLEPKSAISHLLLAHLLKKLQKEDDAKTELESLLSYHPNYIPALRER
mgnify:CR=1 FL=1